MRTKNSLSLLVSVVVLITASLLHAQPAPSHNFPPVKNNGNKQAPPPVETPTTLTFFENSNMTGTSYTVSLQPPLSVQATRVIPSSELAAAHLTTPDLAGGKVSAVRMVCGTRPSRASLFDIDWSQSSSGTMLECNPGQTASVDLSSQTLSRNLDNKINAAALVAHVRASDNLPHDIGFSFLFSSVWKTNMQSLPSGATPLWTQIWIEDFNDIHIEQAVQLDSFWCTARDSVFDMRINVSASAFKPVFKVYPLQVYVPTGFGDSWGCHDGMVSKLNDALISAKAKLESQLPQLVLGNPSSSVFYFDPESTTQGYDLFFWK
jgi:hypothetical protein